MPESFPAELLNRLKLAEEVEIETGAGSEAPPHRTVIWVVVDAFGRVLIRTFRGAGSRWYREISRKPDCVLHLDGLLVPVTAQHATDPDRVAACSRGYVEKYATHPATPRMLAAENLATTLELVPR